MDSSSAAPGQDEAHLLFAPLQPGQFALTLRSVLTNPQIRKLKALGQLLEPVVRVGHAGLSDALIASLNQALDDHELVKVKFSDLKDRKKELSPQLAARTASHLIMRVGNVVVLYRQHPDPAKRRIKFDNE